MLKKFTVKRSLDILVAGFGLILLSPVLVVVASLVWLQMGAPVFFRQMRPGKNGAPFVMVKFRTMHFLSDVTGCPLSDAERLTKLGQYLRASSFDELPTLWNVLKGEMSLVGPRPLLMEYLPLYSPKQARRHEVRPGVTGWAQVNGRNAISWEQKFELDVWYVDNQSFFLDMRILYMTLKKVLKREGISAEGQATIDKFTGTKP